MPFQFTVVRRISGLGRSITSCLPRTTNWSWGCAKLGNFGFQIAHFLALIVPFVSEGPEGTGRRVHRVCKGAVQAFKLGPQHGKLSAKRGNLLNRTCSRNLPFESPRERQ
jgi:hypothetical protein